MRRVRIIGRGNQIFIGCARSVGEFLLIECKPVAVLKVGEPKITLTAGTDVFHPSLHALVLAFEKAPIAVYLVHGIGTDRRGIPPCGRSLRIFRNDIGHGLRDAVLFGLLGGDVAQPLAEKQRDVIVKRGRAAEHLCVARPPESFITLGAVGGNIQKVSPLSPYDILLQTVDAGVVALERPRFFHIGMQDQQTKFAERRPFSALYPDITEPVCRKMRTKRLLFAIQNVFILRLRAAQIGRIKVPRLVEHFGMREDDPLSPPPLECKLHNA